MKKNQKQSFFKENGLSIVLVLFFISIICLQIYTGWRTYNAEQQEEGRAGIRFLSYVGSNHSIEATFENWESEFLQMFVYVLLTVFLFQKGSAESKSLDKEEEVDRIPKASADAPEPVKKGGWQLKIYKNSLSIAFALLFLFSIVVHFIGSYGLNNEERLQKQLPPLSVMSYLGESKFWFESFQNWQSEFLAVFSIVFLSIFLRQYGSPESKPVDAPHSETGH